MIELQSIFNLQGPVDEDRYQNQSRKGGGAAASPFSSSQNFVDVRPARLVVIGLLLELLVLPLEKSKLQKENSL